MPLAIEVRGEVVASNFPEFKQLINTSLAAINQELKTDEDFGQAETDVKSMKEVESAVTEAKKIALEQAEQLHQLFAEMDDVSGKVKDTRLDLEKKIKARKEQLKKNLIIQSIDTVKSLGIIKYMVYQHRLTNAIKGKKTVAGMEKALNGELSAITDEIKATTKVINDFEAANGVDLIMDRDDLIITSAELVEKELQRRLDLKKANDERRKAEEEAAKAKAAVEEQAETVSPTPQSKAAPPPQPPNTLASTKISGSQVDDDIQKEWEAFQAKILEAFKPIKKAKEGLEYHVNQERVKPFADALNVAWKELKES